MSMKNFLLVALAVWCTHSIARVSGSDNEKFNIAAGQLAISKIDPKISKNNATFSVSINNENFDFLYGVKYVYFEERNKNLMSRMIIEDYIGGFSQPPAVIFYDFTKKVPEILSISDSLDIEEVCWNNTPLLIDSGSNWYGMRGQHLARVQPPKICRNKAVN